MGVLPACPRAPHRPHPHCPGHGHVTSTVFQKDRGSDNCSSHWGRPGPASRQHLSRCAKAFPWAFSEPGSGGAGPAWPVRSLPARPPLPIWPAPVPALSPTSNGLVPQSAWGPLPSTGPCGPGCAPGSSHLWASSVGATTGRCTGFRSIPPYSCPLEPQNVASLGNGLHRRNEAIPDLGGFESNVSGPCRKGDADKQREDSL